MAFTEEQTRALTARGINVLVSASAGSGKTTVMVERILALISEGYSLKDMLICTYTNAAASDMREKISSRLIAKSLEGDERFTRELKLLPTARIGTIDSWCQKTVKNYFYLVDVGADFDVMDEGESTACAFEVMDELIEEKLSAGDEQFYFTYESMIQSRRDDYFKAVTYKLCQFASTQENPEKWLDGSLGHYEGEVADKIIAEYYDKKRKALEERINELTEEANAVGYAKLAKNNADLISKLYGNPVSSKFTVDKDFPDLNEKRKRLMSKITTLVNEIKGVEEIEESATVLPYASVIVEFCKETLKRLKKVKLDRCKLDYNDIEHLAYEIALDEVAGEEIRAVNKLVFVDEYQDVNPLQDALISRVVGKELYVVGDVKQSIYAFRMSDPDVFVDKYEHYDEYGFAPPMEFRMNFRSKTEILDYCNDVFARAMTPDFGKVDYESVALQSGKSEYGGRVRLTLVNAPKVKEEVKGGVYSVLDDLGEGEEKGEVTATVVAGKIFELLGKTAEIDGEIRPVEPKDIVVLFRATTAPSLRLLYDKLKAGGADVFIKSKTRFETENEIRPLIAFLRAVNDGTDEIALVSYLLSPFGGLNENELYEVVTGAKKEGLVAKVYSYASGESETAQKVKSALSRLEKYSALSGKRTVCQLLGELISETQYFNGLLKGESGQAGAIVVSQYLDFLSTLKSANSLGDYLDYSEKSRQEFEPSAPENVIKIMTMHSSKGLEFPFVFIIDCDQQFNTKNDTGNLVMDKELGVAFARKDEEGDTVKNKLYSAMKIKKTLAGKEESLRLLYVALTRAKEGLFLFAKNDYDGDVEPFEASSFMDWIAPVSAGVTEVVDPASVVLPNEQKAEEKGVRADPHTIEAIKKKIDFVYPYESVKIKATVTGIAGENQYSPAEKTRDDDKIMALGTAYHKIMEHMDFTKEFDEAKSKILPLFTAEIKENGVKNAFKNVKNLLGELGGVAYKEQSFVYSEEDGRLVQGVIDLLIVCKDSAVILDYKLTGADRIEKPEYARQLNIYANAVEGILKLPVSQLYLCSLTDDCLKSVERRRNLG